MQKSGRKWPIHTNRLESTSLSPSLSEESVGVETLSDNHQLLFSSSTLATFSRSVCRIPVCVISSCLVMRLWCILSPSQPSPRIASSRNNATSSRPGTTEYAVIMSSAVMPLAVLESGEQPWVRRCEMRVGGANSVAWCKGVQPAEQRCQ